MPDPAIAMSTESEEQGFADAVAAFAKDEAPVPEPALAPPQVPPPPTPEPEPEQKAATEETPAEEAINKDTAEKTPPQEFEEEYVEFQGKQKERFNSVYGTMRRFERENLTLQQQLQRLQQQLQTQPPPVQHQPLQPSQPTTFGEAKPLLANYETADQWGEAVADWSARKAESVAIARLEQQTQQRYEQESQQRTVDYINARIVEGQKQFGTREFNAASKDVIEFAPAGSSMYNLLIGLDQFPSVVTHLAKNLPEADRISSLRYEDQVFELKSLERKIALAAKSKSNNNKQATKVEAPGAGEEPGKPAVSINKLRSAAKASGNTKDWAAVFQADPTM